MYLMERGFRSSSLVYHTTRTIYQAHGSVKAVLHEAVTALQSVAIILYGDSLSEFYY